MKTFLTIAAVSAALLMGTASAQTTTVPPTAPPAPAAPAAAAPQAVNPNAEVTNKAVDLTAADDAAIYREATMSPAERAQIPIRLGDNVPLTVKTTPVPDSLNIEKARGLWFTVVPTIRGGFTYQDVILIDANHKVVRIIQRPHD